MRKGVCSSVSFVELVVDFKFVLLLMWKIDEEVSVNSLQESKKERGARLDNHAESQRCRSIHRITCHNF